VKSDGDNERGEYLQLFKDEPGSPLRAELKWPPRYASLTHNFPCLAPQTEKWRGACRRLFACGRNAASGAGSWKLPPDVKLSTTRDLARCDRACVAPLSALSLYLRLSPGTFDFLTSKLYPQHYMLRSIITPTRRGTRRKD